MTEQIKVRFISGGHQPNPMTTRDCTVGKVYGATRLPKGSRTHYGNVVNTDDGIELVDDAGDVVSTAIQWGWEVVEE